ncbi:wsv157 [White spot syndrome virus]|uniref:Wsv157 n=4 Tax=White spot syndrome virus TaxID=342409 RepID=Q8VB40_WSSVS|nr:wsv157 [Shrimp white spot syndrome virus]AFX59535.1 wsv157 [White spot syndrome virus]AAL33161.1 wsv157 [Shrimp white spot syndrome virus]AAL89081.1 WSSV213 [Shrimp white spot syndrome virus]AWQ60339.1 wsv157 [Shrimp white spot syndrome virus]AWQ60752.1 wsv157 [Shrimp white spot syndrome virus]
MTVPEWSFDFTHANSALFTLDSVLVLKHEEEMCLFPYRLFFCPSYLPLMLVELALNIPPNISDLQIS